MFMSFVIYRGLSLCADVHHDVTDFKFHGILRNKKTLFLEIETWLFYKIKKLLTNASNSGASSREKLSF